MRRCPRKRRLTFIIRCLIRSRCCVSPTSPNTLYRLIKRCFALLTRLPTDILNTITIKTRFITGIHPLPELNFRSGSLWRTRRLITPVKSVTFMVTQLFLSTQWQGRQRPLAFPVTSTRVRRSRRTPLARETLSRVTRKLRQKFLVKLRTRRRPLSGLTFSGTSGVRLI